MTRSMLNRAVARRTRESLATIAILGFGPLVEDLPDRDAAPRHLGLDCPGCGQPIHLTDAGIASLPAEADCPRCDAAYPYEYAEVYQTDPEPVGPDTDPSAGGWAT